MHFFSVVCKGYHFNTDNFFFYILFVLKEKIF